MTLIDQVNTDPIDAIYDELGRVHAGMLGVVGSDQHAQPMSHHLDKPERALWFIGSSDTDLVRSIEVSAVGTYIVIGKDQTFHASMTGPLTIVDDPAKLDEVWSVYSAAWFDKGKRDPKVTLIRFSPTEAAVWASTGSAVKFGFELARSLVSEEAKPDVGTHRVVSFA